MKTNEQKQEYIRLRAEGRSYSYIAEALHISKSTCTKWEKSLASDIAALKAEELNALYDTYHMKKEARIHQLGGTLQKIEDALTSADLSAMPPEKLLEYKLKYAEALNKEYISTAPAYKITSTATPDMIVEALADLLNRVRAGEVSAEQANKESSILSNLLKAYDTVEVKAKIEALEKLLEEDT